MTRDLQSAVRKHAAKSFASRIVKRNQKRSKKYFGTFSEGAAQFGENVASMEV